ALPVGSQLQVVTGTNGTIAEVLKWGAAGQTGDFIQFQNNAGTVLAKIDKDGKFYGDGSNLTGVSDSTKVAKAGDTMTGPLVNNSNSLSTALAVTQTGAGKAATFMGGNVGVGTISPVDPLAVGSAINASATHALLNLSNT